MFVLAKRNIILPAPGPGVAPVALKKDLFAEVPEWAAETAYFSALVADGKIVITEHSDKAVQTAAEKPVRKRKAAAEDATPEPAAKAE